LPRSVCPEPTTTAPVVEPANESTTSSPVLEVTTRSGSAVLPFSVAAVPNVEVCATPVINTAVAQMSAAPDRVITTLPVVASGATIAHSSDPMNAVDRLAAARLVNASPLNVTLETVRSTLECLCAMATTRHRLEPVAVPENVSEVALLTVKFVGRDRRPTIIGGDGPTQQRLRVPRRTGQDRRVGYLERIRRRVGCLNELIVDV
jgi:hypothetical protein